MSNPTTMWIAGFDLHGNAQAAEVTVKVTDKQITVVSQNTPGSARLLGHRTRFPKGDDCPLNDFRYNAIKFQADELLREKAKLIERTKEVTLKLNKLQDLVDKT